MRDMFIEALTAKYAADIKVAKATQQMWWSGLVVKRNVSKGEYDLEMIEYNTIRRKYGKR